MSYANFVYTREWIKFYHCQSSHNTKRMITLRRAVAQIRWLLQHSNSKEEIETAKKWIETFQLDSIPRAPFVISYSRSSGPGGQKVNKTSSKATISLEPFQWLNPKICSWIPSAVISQLQHKGLRYQTKGGGLLIQSDTHRCRDANTDECFQKLLREIKTSVFFEGETSAEDKEKWEKLAKARKERQKEDKKRQSEKRKSRNMKFDY